jgi:hypothetical protein
VLTFTGGRKSRDLWLERAVSNAGERLSAERERLFAALDLRRHRRVLVLNAGDGLLAWEALRRVPEGGVWALADIARALQHYFRFDYLTNDETKFNKQREVALDVDLTGRIKVSYREAARRTLEEWTKERCAPGRIVSVRSVGLLAPVFLFHSILVPPRKHQE